MQSVVIFCSNLNFSWKNERNFFFLHNVLSQSNIQPTDISEQRHTQNMHSITLTSCLCCCFFSFVTSRFGTDISIERVSHSYKAKWSKTQKRKKKLLSGKLSRVKLQLCVIYKSYIILCSGFVIQAQRRCLFFFHFQWISVSFVLFCTHWNSTSNANVHNEFTVVERMTVKNAWG